MRPQQLSDTRLRPRRGMLLAFTPASSQHLADIPAQVVYIWPRCRSGAYLVTLEYADAVRVGQAWIHHIDAFMDELYAPIPETSAGSVPSTQPTPRWRALHVGGGPYAARCHRGSPEQGDQHGRPVREECDL